MTSQNDLKDEIYIKSFLKEVLKDKNIELFEKLQETKSIPIAFAYAFQIINLDPGTKSINIDGSKAKHPWILKI